MKSRRNIEEISSLELLFDPICNMFGGIIFIAILVVILTSLTSAKKAQNTASATRASLDARIRTDEMTHQIADMERATALLERIEAQTISPAQHSTKNAIDQIRVAQADAQRRAAEAEAWLKGLDQWKRQSLDLDKSMETRRAEVEQLKDRLEQTTRSNTLDVRLPMEQVTRRLQVIFILAHNRAYFVPLASGSGALKGLFDGHVTIETRTSLFGSSGDSGMIVTPVKDKGFSATEDRDGRELEKVFRHIDPSAYFVDLFVVGDSIPTFQAMRSRLLTRGFRYNVHTSESPTVYFNAAKEVHTQ